MDPKFATMNIFSEKNLFKLFIKIKLKYIFTINMFATAEKTMKSELSYKTGIFFSCW